MQGFNWGFTPEVLPNGITLWFLSIPWVNFITARLVLDRGSRDDLPGEEGAMHLIEHQLFKSPEYSGSSSFIFRMADQGIYLNANTATDCLTLSVKSGSSQFSRAWDHAHRTLQGQYIGLGLEGEKNVVTREFLEKKIDLRWDNWLRSELKDLHSPDLLRLHSPASVLGTSNSLGSLSEENLNRYWESALNATNNVIIAGNIEMAQALDLVGRLEISHVAFDPKRLITTPTSPSGDRRIKTTWGQCGASIVGSHVYLQVLSVAVVSPVTHMINGILERMIEDGIADRLRDRLCLVYSWHVSVDNWIDHVQLHINFSVEEHNIDAAVEALWEVINSLDEKGFSRALHANIADQEMFDPSCGEVVESMRVVQLLVNHRQIIGNAEKLSILNALTWEQVQQYWQETFQGRLVSIAVTDR